MDIESAIKEYQCPGCTCGSDLECGVFRQDNKVTQCESHVAGTLHSLAGRLLLGMPTGFNRVGMAKDGPEINIFNSYNGFVDQWKGYGTFNIPVWKYLDKHGNTLVRGLMPRINIPFIHVILGDCTDKIACLEIFNDDIKEMD